MRVRIPPFAPALLSARRSSDTTPQTMRGARTAATRSRRDRSSSSNASFRSLSTVMTPTTFPEARMGTTIKSDRKDALDRHDPDDLPGGADGHDNLSARRLRFVLTPRDFDPGVPPSLLQDSGHPVAEIRQRDRRPGRRLLDAAHQDVGIREGDLDMQGVVEPVEIVEQSDDAGDLDDLRLVEMPPQLAEDRIGDLSRTIRHRVGELQGGLLVGREGMARGVVQPGEGIVTDS